MAVTIKDVAKLAGVSPSTVSRTCKNHPSISQETKDRVKKAMEELGYEQNNLQQNISMRKIGVVFPKSKTDVYENPFYLEAIKGIGKYCNKKQYTLLVITGETDEELIRSIKASEADGFIFLYSNSLINFLFSNCLNIDNCILYLSNLFFSITPTSSYFNTHFISANDNPQFSCWLS